MTIQELIAFLQTQAGEHGQHCEVVFGDDITGPFFEEYAPSLKATQTAVTKSDGQEGWGPVRAIELTLDEK